MPPDTPAGMPPMIRRLFQSECPVCGRTWPASWWDEWLYPVHYVGVHLELPLWPEP